MAALEKDRFFAVAEEQGQTLTFDDVLLQPGLSDFSPVETDITSYFSRNIELKKPFVSAAMDTVTTSRMAIAMAELGGIGVIHASMSIAEQKKEVRRVKLRYNGIIENPRTARPEQTVESLLQYCEDNRFDFRTFPVVSGDNTFVGLITQNDIMLSESPSDLLKDIMTEAVQVTTAPAGTSIQEAFDLMQTNRRKTLPVVSADGKLSGLYILSDVSRCMQEHTDASLDKNGRLLVAAAIPTDDNAVDRVAAMQRYLDVAVIDTAQGDSKFARRTLEKLKEHFGNSLDVVIGNVSNAESAKVLVAMGADGLKIGQGAGSICTTRRETGIGVPQISAIYECAKALRDTDVPICADGGIVYNGDIPKALAAGGHTVMMGNRLAGTDEAPGEVTIRNGIQVKEYRGMGSAAALESSAASRNRYSTGGSETALPEGVEGFKPYNGPVAKIIEDGAKAVRKCMSYVGVSTVEELRSNKTKFSRITTAGQIESHPHDILT